MNETQAIQELNLNIKYQNIKPERFTQVGYEFEKGSYVFLFMLPINFLKKRK